MDWIVTTARTIEEAETRALDLLGVDSDDAEIQVIEEGKTGLFGRTKSEARVRARIKPKAPPAKEERRPQRGGGGGGRNRGGNNKGGGGGGGNKSRQRSNGNGGGDSRGGGGGGRNKSEGGGDRKRASGGGDNRGGGGGGRNKSEGGGGRNRGGGGDNRGGGGRGRNNNSDVSREDRVEMPVDEQRETLEGFVTGVATSFDSTAKVTLVEEGTTLLAKVNGDDLGRLIGNKASTLQALEELARTAMHRAAAGRRYHRIQVDVDDYRARRREALARFATDLAEGVAATGETKAMEPMGAADRKLVHDAVAEVGGVETMSEGRDPRRYIVISATNGTDEEE